jgi:hypothetical protein
VDPSLVHWLCAATNGACTVPKGQSIGQAGLRHAVERTRTEHVPVPWRRRYGIAHSSAPMRGGGRESAASVATCGSAQTLTAIRPIVRVGIPSSSEALPTQGDRSWQGRHSWH